jgi:hypothetical protein
MPMPVPICNALFLIWREEPGWRVTGKKMLRKRHECKEAEITRNLEDYKMASLSSVPFTQFC